MGPAVGVVVIDEELAGAARDNTGEVVKELRGRKGDGDATAEADVGAEGRVNDERGGKDGVAAKAAGAGGADDVGAAK